MSVRLDFVASKPVSAALCAATWHRYGHTQYSRLALAAESTRLEPTINASAYQVRSPRTSVFCVAQAQLAGAFLVSERSR